MHQGWSYGPDSTEGAHDAVPKPLDRWGGDTPSPNPIPDAYGI